MGHEIGHYALRHIMSNLLMLLDRHRHHLRARANLIFTRLSKGERWGVRDVADPAGIAAVVRDHLVSRHHLHADQQQHRTVPREPSRHVSASTPRANLMASPKRQSCSPNIARWSLARLKNGSSMTTRPATRACTTRCNGKRTRSLLGRLAPGSPGGPPVGWRPDFVVMSARPENAPRATAAPAEPVAPAPVAPSPAAPSN